MGKPILAISIPPSWAGRYGRFRLGPEATRASREVLTSDTHTWVRRHTGPPGEDHPGLQLKGA